MGRWAQRRRGSGGGGPTTPINFITSAVIQNETDIIVTWQYDLDVTDLATADFLSNPSAQTPDSLTQQGANSGLLFFITDISADDDLLFNGPEPYFTSPQTVPYT